MITSGAHTRFANKPKLVGGFNPSEKYEFVSWDDEIPEKKDT